MEPALSSKQGKTGMANAPYEEFEHPADIGLRAKGRSLAELFENAGQGMIELMLDPRTVRARQSRPITASGDDTEMMLVAWLEEILFAFDADGFAPREVQIELLAEGQVRGCLRGEAVDERRHELRNAIKAVTWHDLKVQRRGDAYEVRIIFDV
jgi:SHS2 domain-containing protein